MTPGAQPASRWPIDGIPIEEGIPVEEVFRSQGVRPVGSLRELAHPELWDSDEDYENFLADLYASRHSDIG
ncbi:hypothetical protein [Protofrankia coriariae]|uniref:hypothetical protein n=1 Tax=Protofrankia coriariae TaxID=1562887 RepID=UPI000A327E34|nr:hypothetical protein [Protofrankia coriariae]